LTIPFADSLSDRSTTYLATQVSTLNRSFVGTGVIAGAEAVLLGTVSARTELACAFACFTNPHCMAFHLVDEMLSEVTAGKRCDLLGSVSSTLNYSTVFVDVAGKQLVLLATGTASQLTRECVCPGGVFNFFLYEC